ncbi:MFS transporter [Erwinia sp. S43]|uniref:MFS transporter n=1 Tax=Pantoea coffeiphila TaxID=1465635 RepID=A0A2S9I6N3_9GAMM|nr:MULTISPECIES: MFS transporter [Erwiniaceae]MBK0031070.1 MFS transporter [Erwinia sp. S43]PRD13463.1 MFS transporter [Pantoea coffeiphila]
MPKYKKYITLLLLGFSGGAIFVFPYLKYIFYDDVLTSLGIGNADSGLLLTAYSLGCVALYIPGGILADKLSPRISVVASLFAATALTLIFAFFFNFASALVVWFLMAFASGFVFWSAVLKAVRIISEEQDQGLMYGIYYSANGAATAIINYLCLKVFGYSGGGSHGLFMAVLLMACFTGVSAIALMFFLKGFEKSETKEEDKFKFADLSLVVKNPSVWMVSIIFFCIYAVYTCSSYYTPYLTWLGMSADNSAELSILRINMAMMIASPIGGYLADKVFKSTLKWIMYGSILLAVSIVATVMVGGDNLQLTSIISIIPGWLVMSMYGIMFSSFKEINVPVKVSGTAIGFASIISYSPDLFMNTVYGTVLDKYQGADTMTAYKIIFLSLACLAVLSVILSLWVLSRNAVKKNRISERLVNN